jgi:hypothetical protein
MTYLGYSLALLLVLTGVSDGNDKRAPREPTLLVPSDSHEADVPPFASEAHPQCDKAGNIYFHLWNNNGSMANIMRLPPAANEGKLLGVPDEYAQAGRVVFNDYSVAPSGKVQMFIGVMGADAKPYILKFDADGEFDKAVPFALADGVVITNIVAFDNGATLLVGHYNKAAPTELKGKSYLVTLDAYGKLNRVEHALLPNANFDAEDLSPGASSSDDGNAYFLFGDYVWVLSQTGEVVQRIHIEKPDPNDQPANVRVSGNWIVVDLATRTPSPDHPDADRSEQPISFRFLLVDVIGGQTIGLYELPKELRGLDEVCFSRKEGLKFMKRQKGKVNFFSASF